MAVGFHRLDLIRYEKDKFGGRRRYYTTPLSGDQIKKVRACVLHGLGLFSLTKHL